MVMITSVQRFSVSGAAVSLVDIAGVDCPERKEGRPVGEPYSWLA